jgi:L-fucose mutarotase
VLYGINPIVGPELLRALRAMGHGDEIVLADANYPSEAKGKRLIRMDGHDTVTVLDAVLSLMPLDTFVDHSAFRMEVVGDPKAVPEVCREFAKVLRRRAPGHKLAALERFAFYERAEQAFVTVATSEARLYGNIILKKGVIARDG